MRIISIVLIAVLLGGCASVAVRSDGRQYGQFFPAMKRNVQMIDSAYAANNWLFPPGILTFFAVVDMPMSLCTDSLFIPVDIVVWIARRGQDESE